MDGGLKVPLCSSQPSGMHKHHKVIYEERASERSLNPRSDTVYGHSKESIIEDTSLRASSDHSVTHTQSAAFPTNNSTIQEMKELELGRICGWDRGGGGVPALQKCQALSQDAKAHQPLNVTVRRLPKGNPNSTLLQETCNFRKINIHLMV
ncbi:hypothetical protein J6590_072986 [Homalodisca vitripennis]|nr:hypothetical protein J6590_072986 [Homalodisca vitripennis]